MNVALVGAGNIADALRGVHRGAAGLDVRRRDRPRAARARRRSSRSTAAARTLARRAARRRRGRRRRQPRRSRRRTRRSRARRSRRGSTCTPRSRSRSRPRGARARRARGERGVRLSCAPATLLGEAQQTAWKLVRDGALGRVRAAYAEANWGRIERWHPDPRSALRGRAAGRRRRLPAHDPDRDVRAGAPRRRVRDDARSPSGRGSTASAVPAPRRPTSTSRCSSSRTASSRG